MSQTVSSVPIPPPPPPPPKPLTSTLNHSYQPARQEQNLTIDASFRDEPHFSHNHGQGFNDNRYRSHQNHPASDDDDDDEEITVPPAFLSPKFRESNKSLHQQQQQQQPFVHSHLQQNSNPIPQERRSIMNSSRLDDNDRNRSNHHQVKAQHHFPGPFSLRPIPEGRHENESPDESIDKDTVARYQYQRRQKEDQDEDDRTDVGVKNEATQTRSVPVLSSLFLRKPGNQLLSIQYFLLHLSLSLCLMRVSGKFHFCLINEY